MAEYRLKNSGVIIDETKTKNYGRQLTQRRNNMRKNYESSASWRINLLWNPLTSAAPMTSKSLKAVKTLNCGM